LSNIVAAQSNVIGAIASGEHAENQTSGTSAEAALLRVAWGARFFRSVDGCCHARVSIGDRDEILAVKGAAFRSWLLDGYLKEYGKLPSHWAVSRVLEALEARTRFETGSPTVYVRVGCHQEDKESSYYLDLGDPSGRAVKIGALGWSVVDRPVVHFNFAARMLFSNNETHIIHAERPVILNGIDEFVRRGDLVDRGLFLDLPSIAPGSRRPEDEFWASFAEVYPRILGGLLDAVAGAMRELPSVKLPELPRMADFARFGEAVGRGLGWPAGTFISAYHDNRRASSAGALEDSVVAVTLLELASRGDLPEQAKSPTDLLSFLSEMADRKAVSSARWPKTPSTLGNELRRLAPQLRAHGMSVAFSKTHQSRMITISYRAGSDYSAAAV